MLMHVITNFTANAGAEAMLSRLLNSAEGDLVVPLMGVSDRYRSAAPASVRFRPLLATSTLAMGWTIPRLAQIIEEERPSAVLCWMYHAMVVGTLAAKFSRRSTRLYWNVRQSLDDRSVLSFSTRTALRLSRMLSPSPDAIIFNSERALKLHRDFGYRNTNMRFIPNGFTVDEPASRVPTAVRVFGIAARLNPQKDYRTFFKAAAIVARRHPDVRFIAVGLGLSDDNEHVRQMISKSGVPPGSVALAGECSDMRKFYEDIDVLVLSSKTEGFPNVIAEAMSVGRPVISTDVGDASVIVGAAGIIIRPGDPQALAAAMEQMVRLTATEYADLSHAAYNRIAENYSVKSATENYRLLVSA